MYWLKVGITIVSICIAITASSQGAYRPYQPAYRVVTSERAVRELWGAVLRFEKFVRTHEDEMYGYKRDIGYPMYLYFIGDMYVRLWQRFHEREYLEKAERCASFIIKIKENNYTWKLYDKATKNANPLYNYLFSELAISLWRVTGKEGYKELAGKIIHSLNSPELFDSKANRFLGNYNHNFLCFLAVAHYYGMTGEKINEDLMRKALSAYRYALSGYDSGSGKWHYNEGNKNTGYYDGHDACYQLFEIMVFLSYLDEVKAIFPNIAADFLSFIPSMVKVVEDHISDHGTFYYNQEIKDSTESAAQTLAAFQLIDEYLQKDHEQLHLKAIETLIRRQDVNGGFYTIPNPGEIRLHFCDEIGSLTSRYLLRIGR